MKNLRTIAKQLSIRWKTMIAVALILLLLLGVVALTISYYSTHYYTGLQQQYYEQIMKEVSYQMNSIYSSVDELYLTFNSQRPFTQDTLRDDTVFQEINSQIRFEHSVQNVINSNNLQNCIIGTLFYLNDDVRWYIGVNSIANGFVLSDTDWFRAFVSGGKRKMLYGPLMEDFKPVNTERFDCLYYIAPYGTSANGAPFILFTIKMESLTDLVDTFLQDGRRIVITGPDGTLLHTAGFADEAEATELLPQLEEQLNSQGLVSDFVGDYYACTYHLDNFGWQITFLDDTKAVFSDLHQMTAQIILMIAAFTLLSVVLAYLLIRRITLPLTLLNQYIDLIEDDPDAYIQPDPNVDTGKIGQRLNEMKQKLQTANREMYGLRLQEKEAQVSALQAQINPHFLYNTLDNIYCIAQLGDTEPIICLSEKLSQMMRYSMSMKQNIVSLEHELQHVESYVAILNVRFDNRLHLENQIPVELNHAAVLKLSLQPLVENAWYHGVLAKKEPFGRVILSSFVEAGVLFLSVENDGQNITKERCAELNRQLSEVHYGKGNYNTSHGIALENISNRLKLTFGQDYGLRLEPRIKGGCKVTMSLPMHLTQQALSEHPSET